MRLWCMHCLMFQVKYISSNGDPFFTEKKIIQNPSHIFVKQPGSKIASLGQDTKAAPSTWLQWIPKEGSLLSWLPRVKAVYLFIYFCELNTFLYFKAFSWMIVLEKCNCLISLRLKRRRSPFFSYLSNKWNKR